MPGFPAYYLKTRMKVKMSNNNSNTGKYNNRRSINGETLKAGQVLVPYWIQDGSRFNQNEIIYENLTIYYYDEFYFIIGFIPIVESNFDAYMSFFQNELLDYYNLHKKNKFNIVSLEQLAESSDLGQKY